MEEKWCIKVTEKNCEGLNQYLKENSNKYSDYNSTWCVNSSLGTTKETYYFYSEQPVDKVHSSTAKYGNFTEITYEDFLNLNNFGITSDCPKELITILKKLKVK